MNRTAIAKELVKVAKALVASGFYFTVRADSAEEADAIKDIVHDWSNHLKVSGSGEIEVSGKDEGELEELVGVLAKKGYQPSKVFRG